MGRIDDWINRQRHNRGYGVQSPSSFFFVTQVLKERLPYYAYPALETIATAERYTAKRLKELFRIANYHNPTNCIAINSPGVATAMAMARPSAMKYSIGNKQASMQTEALLASCNCQIRNGNPLEQLKEVLAEVGEIGLLYIGKTKQQAELLETALCYTNNCSLIVVEGIHNNKATEMWWQTVVENSSAVVTYDLYSVGLLYFDKERYKQHYTLKR